MSTSRVLAAIIVVLGLTVALIPKFIFPICESDHLGLVSAYHPIMRCFWFGQTELILGAVVFLAGLVVLCRPASQTAFVVSIIVMAIGLAVILVSLNAVIGSTCGHRGSICQIGTKPAERITGTLIIITGLFLMIPYIKKRELK